MKPPELAPPLPPEPPRFPLNVQSDIVKLFSLQIPPVPPEPPGPPRRSYQMKLRCGPEGSAEPPFPPRFPVNVQACKTTGPSPKMPPPSPPSELLELG